MLKVKLSVSLLGEKGLKPFLDDFIDCSRILIPEKGQKQRSRIEWHVTLCLSHPEKAMALPDL